MTKTIASIIFILLFQFGLAQDGFSQIQDTIHPSSIELLSDAQGVYILGAPGSILSLEIEGEEEYITSTNQKYYLPINPDHKGSLQYIGTKNNKAKLYHIAQTKSGQPRVQSIPLWLSLLPPLLAIILALIFKEVIVSLFAGIWAGAFIAGGMRLDSFYYFISSFFDVVKSYVATALSDGGHISVILFSLLIGGMVAIISKNGGMAGVVKSLSKYAKSSRSTQFITWLLGVAIFFDDYANTLIVGNTMRSVTDKFKISREKLAYIVDSTAAPVASIAFITTWIGAELGYIDDGLAKIGLNDEYTPYSVFISSLKYSYYTIFTLIFILLLIYLKKDFGPMYKAELRAKTTGRVSPAATKAEDEPDMEDLDPVEGADLKWYNAAIPVITVILVTIFGLLDTGFDSIFSGMDGVKYSWGAIWDNMGDEGFVKKIGNIIGSADSYSALIWASLAGVVMAIVMTLSGKIMNLFDTMHWMTTGFKTMMPALIILTLAWSLAITTDQLHTAEYISNALQGNISPYLLPALVFVLAAFISFSTGSSWSTMAILYPIAIPTTYGVCLSSGLDPEATMEILYNVIATVLSASVLGDHCSPISDTTILSSLASDCNHIDHVKTQLPYALTVGGIALTCKIIATYLGGGAFLSLVLLIAAVGAMYLIIKTIGKSVDSTPISEA